MGGVGSSQTLWPHLFDQDQPCVVVRVEAQLRDDGGDVVRAHGRVLLVHQTVPVTLKLEKYSSEAVSSTVNKKIVKTTPQIGNWYALTSARRSSVIL